MSVFFIRKTLAMTAMMLLMAIGWSGCSSPSNQWGGYRNFPDSEWRYGDTLQFNVEHFDTLCTGRWVIALRHPSDFAYKNVAVELTFRDEHRGEVKDTLLLELADDHGTWRGRGIGPSLQVADTVEGQWCHRSATPAVLRHVLRTDTLKGLNQIGLFFVPVNEPITWCTD